MMEAEQHQEVPMEEEHQEDERTVGWPARCGGASLVTNDFSPVNWLIVWLVLFHRR
jgi:hypothetical protein